MTKLSSLGFQAHAIDGTNLIAQSGNGSGDTRIETFLRQLAITSVTIGTGVIGLNYFTADKNLTVSAMAIASGGTATSIATLVRAGIFSVDGSGNLTLVAASADVHAAGANIVAGSANQPAFGVINTLYSIPLTLAGDLTTPQASYPLVLNQRYAFGLIQVATVAATIIGVSSPTINQLILINLAPRVVGGRSGQADLASMTSGQVNTNIQPIYVSAQ